MSRAEFDIALTLPGDKSVPCSDWRLINYLSLEVIEQTLIITKMRHCYISLYSFDRDCILCFLAKFYILFIATLRISSYFFVFVILVSVTLLTDTLIRRAEWRMMSKAFGSACICKCIIRTGIWLECELEWKNLTILWS